MPSFVVNYTEVKNFKPIPIRYYARRIALDALSLKDSFDFRTASLLKTPRIQFLYIHHIFKDEENKFRRMLEFLAKEHVFISYSEAIMRLRENLIDKPYIAFSSDDGFKNNLAAASILKEFNATACFFICPGMIGETDRRRIEKFCSSKLTFPPIEFLNWSDVETLLSGNNEIGGHTMMHADLGKLDEKEFEYEIAECFDVLKHQIGNIQHFAFPYGRRRNLNESAIEFVESTGFETLALAERGCYLQNSSFNFEEDKLIRRDHIILDWPLQHIRYFLVSNILNAQHNAG